MNLWHAQVFADMNEELNAYYKMAHCDPLIIRWHIGTPLANG